MPEKNQRGGAAQGHPSHGSNARTSPTTTGGAHVRIVVSLASLVRALSMLTGASHPNTGCSKAIEDKTLVA